MSEKKNSLEYIDISRPAGGRSSRRQAEAAGRGAGQSRRRRKSSKDRFFTAGTVLCLVIVGILALILFTPLREGMEGFFRKDSGEEDAAAAFLNDQSTKADYPQELRELVEINPEALDFVWDYPNREQYQGKPIDLSGDYTSGQVPLLMQWDKRWGYDSYGDSNIGLAGCGPTCMAMIYLYLTGDTSANPRTMAEFADDNGYHTTDGTAWSFWTDGAAQLGLDGEALSLSESAMKGVLDSGGLIVCSMRPGDFTTTGHFIVIRGYDKNGFYVNDPNHRSTSEKQWSFKQLSGQIKNLWGITG